MKRRIWWLGVVALVLAVWLGLERLGWNDRPLQAQTPIIPVPTSAVPSPTPTLAPTASPSATPASPTVIPPSLPVLPPTPAATPLPLGGEYRDPGGRFSVGILKGYSVSPLVNSVLVEAPSGTLAYTVVVQPQPGANSLGISPFLSQDALAQIAQTTFQRGEGFQAGTVQAVQAGVLLDWSGNLTIGGNTQPVTGVILARPSRSNILLLLIAATKDGSNQVSGAIASLADTLR